MPESHRPFARRLSGHFIEEWKKHIGAEPTLAKINMVLSESVKLNGQRHILIRQPNGGLKPDKQLAQYWNSRINVIIRLDWDNSTAVTVITPIKSARNG